MITRVIIFSKGRPIKGVTFVPKAAPKYPRDILLEVEAMNLTPELHDFTKPLFLLKDGSYKRGDLTYRFDRREIIIIGV